MPNCFNDPGADWIYGNDRQLEGRVTAKAVRRADLVRTVGGVPFDADLAEILLERAVRILARDGGRDCKRVLTDAEIDLLLAGDEPKDFTSCAGARGTPIDTLWG